MGGKPKSAVEIRDFPGMATRPDATDLPPGAAVAQENLASHREGELRTRAGARQVTFEEE